MIGTTMNAISNPLALQSSVSPIQNPQVREASTLSQRRKRDSHTRSARSQRISTESDNHKTLYMPSRLTTQAQVSVSLPRRESFATELFPRQGSNTSIKVVAVPKPECKVPGLPATTLLFDEATGQVKAMLNSTELTGIRTA